MNKKLIIIGACGQGKIAADISIKLNKYNEIYFLDDNENIKECMGFEVIGKIEDVHKYLNDSDIFVAVGNPKIRKRIIEDLKMHNANIPTLIHPSAIIGSNVKIGIGSVIMAGAVINPCAVVGESCIINTSASIDHDCVLGDYVHVSVGSHLAGTVSVGAHTWIGIGATVNNNISLGENLMIGAGAVVVKDIMEEGTYVGVPTRKIK